MPENNKQYFYIVRTIIGMCSMILLIYLFSIKNQDIKPPSIDTYAVINVINTIHPSFNDSYLDLQFLKQELSDKRIVVIGESTHQDGSTFLAKSRLVKFLYDELGFDVLTFEAGFFDMWQLNSNDSIMPEKALYPFWSLSKQTDGLWKHVENNEIYLAGIDIQKTGNVPDSIRKNMLFGYLSNLCSDPISKWHNYYKIADSISYYINSPSSNSKLDHEEIESALTDLKEISSLLHSNKPTMENAAYAALVSGIINWWECVTNYSYGSPRRFEIRDSLMAFNFTNLDKYFKGRKIVLWTSNLHAFKNNHQIVDSSKNFVNLGERLKNEFGDSIYTIVFTSYCREENEIAYNKAPRNSLEYALHLKQWNYLYLSKISNVSIVNGVNQNMYFNTNLGLMTDGIFYIRKMENPIIPKFK